MARGQVEIDVSVSAKFGMKIVEYYFDDQLVAEGTSFPWKGIFKIPTSVNFGTKHILRAIAIDQLFNSAEDEIEISIDSDGNGPEIVFLGPIGRQKISIGTQMHILADVRDFASGVKVVEFFVDDKSIGFDEVPPYEKLFLAKGKLGNHELKIKAWDFHGNISERKIPVMYERQKL